MVVYNTTFMDNATSVLDHLSGFGTAIGSDFLIGNLMLFAFVLIFFVSTSKSTDMTKMFVFNFLLTTFLAVLLHFAGLVGVLSVAIPSVMFILSLITYFTT